MRRFAYRLAVRLGHANVDAMLRSMSAVQLQEWMEFDRLEPFGPKRDDMRFGSIVSTLLNVEASRNRTRGKPKPTMLTPQEAAMLFGEDAEAASRAGAQRKTWRQMKATALEFISTLPTEAPKD